MLTMQLRVELDEGSDRVRFSCDWPYDLEVNDWISLDKEFSAREFRRQISKRSRTKEIIVPGLHGGGIRFKVLNRNTIKFDVEGGTKSCHEEFRYEIPAQPSNLFPIPQRHWSN